MSLKRSVPDELPEDELAAGIVLLDPVLFRLYFFGDGLEEEPTFEQVLMFADESERICLCTGRKIAKTLGLEAIVLQFGLTTWVKGIKEAMFFTPGQAHMTPFLDRVKGRIDKTPFLKMCVRTMRQADDAMIEFWGGARWYFRIEGLSGSDANMVGLRAEMIVGDELAFGNWSCHNSRLQTALPGCRFRYSGVPNGVRTSPFYAIDQMVDGKNWSHHKYPTFINPLYLDKKARQQLIDDYGGEDTQGYVTQVLGLWGTEMQSSFPPGTIAINDRAVYFIKAIVGSAIQSGQEDRIPLVVGIPSIRVKKFALGWDYGYSPDPSVIWGAYCHEDETDWQAYFRLTLRRVAGPHQTLIVHHLIHTVFVGEFIGCMCDNVQAIQGQQAKDPGNIEKYMWANPAGVTETFINNKDQITSLEDDAMAILVKLRNKEFYASLIKKWMINATVGLIGMRLWIGPDTTVGEEFGAISERKNNRSEAVYEFPVDPDNKKRVLDHNFEGFIYLGGAIENGLKVNRTSESEAALLASLGVVGKGQEGYKLPFGNST